MKLQGSFIALAQNKYVLQLCVEYARDKGHQQQYLSVYFLHAVTAASGIWAKKSGADTIH